MTQLCENDRVEAIQADAPRRPLILQSIGTYRVSSSELRGIEGALVARAIVTERPGA